MGSPLPGLNGLSLSDTHTQRVSVRLTVPHPTQKDGHHSVNLLLSLDYFHLSPESSDPINDLNRQAAYPPPSGQGPNKEGSTLLPIGFPPSTTLRPGLA